MNADSPGAGILLYVDKYLFKCLPLTVRRQAPTVFEELRAEAEIESREKVD